MPNYVDGPDSLDMRIENGGNTIRYVNKYTGRQLVSFTCGNFVLNVASKAKPKKKANVTKR